MGPLADLDTWWKGLAEFAGIAAAAAVLVLLPFVRAGLRSLTQNWAYTRALWRILLERGKLEASDPGKGLATLPDPTGPLQITDKARRLFQPITAQLKDLGRQLRKNTLMDSDVLAYEIDRRFRKFLIEKVCSELGLNRLGCLSIAQVIATEGLDRTEPGTPGEYVG